MESYVEIYGRIYFLLNIDFSSASVILREHFLYLNNRFKDEIVVSTFLELSFVPVFVIDNILVS